MTEVVGAPATTGTAPLGRRRGRRFWLAVAVLLAVLAGGIVAATAQALRYAHAQPLQCACGYGWTGPARHLPDTSAGPYDESRVVAIAGEREAIEVVIRNDSPVTQTIVGLPSGAHETGFRPILTITHRDQPSGVTNDALKYFAGPATLPPGAVRWLRYSVIMPCIDHRGSRVWYTGIGVRVRIGWFTEDQTIDLGNQSMALVGRQHRCQ